MRLWAVVPLLVACGGGAAAPPVEQPSGDTAGLQPAVDTTYPAPKRGALIAHSALPGGLNGEWTPQAALCAAPRSLQLLARGDTVDILLLLWLPADGAATGEYAVPGPLDSTAAPRTARVGVQRMQYADLAYRGLSGTVRLERLDRRATGRFDVLLDETVSHERVRYLGVFEGVPVDSAPEALCQPARRDSTAAARGQRPVLD